MFTFKMNCQPSILKAVDTLYTMRMNDEKLTGMMNEIVHHAKKQKMNFTKAALFSAPETSLLEAETSFNKIAMFFTSTWALTGISANISHVKTAQSVYVNKE